MVLKQDKGENFIVERDKKYGGDLEYDSYEFLEKDFVNKKLHPLDLKNAVTKEITNLLNEIDKKKLNQLAEKAYGL